jgi:hypothetical protein
VEGQAETTRVLLLRVYSTFFGNPTFFGAVLECSRAQCRLFPRRTDRDVELWTRQDRPRSSGSATWLSGEKAESLFVVSFAVWYIFCGRRLSSCFRFDACSGVIFIAGTPRGQCALDHRGALPEFIDRL